MGKARLCPRLNAKHQVLMGFAERRFHLLWGLGTGEEEAEVLRALRQGDDFLPEGDSDGELFDPRHTLSGLLSSYLT
jgi:hypothetical protein